MEVGTTVSKPQYHNGGELFLHRLGGHCVLGQNHSHRLANSRPIQQYCPIVDNSTVTAASNPSVIPPEVAIVLLADRGFADGKLMKYLKENLGWHFRIRIKHSLGVFQLLSFVSQAGVSTHSFRRTALTQIHNAGIPLRHIQEISGHGDLGTLQRYLEVSPEHKKKAVSVIGW